MCSCCLFSKYLRKQTSPQSNSNSIQYTSTSHTISVLSVRTHSMYTLLDFSSNILLKHSAHMVIPCGAIESHPSTHYDQGKLKYRCSLQVEIVISDKPSTNSIIPKPIHLLLGFAIGGGRNDFASSRCSTDSATRQIACAHLWIDVCLSISSVFSLDEISYFLIICAV